MPEHRYELIGVGLYSIAEAARLTGIPAATINRWVNGYVRVRHGHRVEHDAVTPSSLPKIEDRVALSFRDLMEVHFIGKLRELGIGWAEIKRTVDLAREILATDHPFGSLKFKTDGRLVFAQIEKSGVFLLRDRQFAFGVVFGPSLFAELEYEGGAVARWRPEAGSRIVVLDPKRSVGKPIVDEFDVQTRVIASAVAAEGSATRIAEWFDIPLPAVRAAVDYERQLLAA